jgi:hypothetical protein
MEPLSEDKTMPKQLDGYRLGVGDDKKDDDARITTYKNVSVSIPNLPWYVTDPAFKALADSYLAAGSTFSTSHDKVGTTEKTLFQARGARDGARGVLDNAYDAVVASVWSHATSIADVKNSGFTVLQVDPNSHTIAMPTAILLRYDAQIAAILVHVKWAVRGQSCLLEVSPDPITPTSWRRLDSTGAKQTLIGYTPGTWWFHAATSRAKGRSDWFGPVSVLVK